jgi:hypothetical protein
MDWQIPLGVATIAFLLVVLWQVRPSFGGERPEGDMDLRAAKKRIEEAKDDASRARALCDAADACAVRVGRSVSARGYYQRAMRADPTSVEIVERAAKGLWKRPRALEGLLWRRLASEPWQGPSAAAQRAALRALARLYDERLRQPLRARALEHALASLREEDP